MGVGLTEDEFWLKQRPFMTEVFGSSDAKEGAKAFVQERPPEWTGA